MDEPWIKGLIISYMMTAGFASSKSDIVIGVMVDLQHGFESLPGVVDKVTNICSRCISQHGHQFEVKWALLKSTNITDVSSTVFSLINEGVSAIVTVLSCTQSRTVSGMAEIFRIPHLSVDLDACPPGEELTLRVTSQYKTLGRVLVDLTEAAGWKQVELYLNKIVDYRTRQQLVLQLSLAGIRTVLRPSTGENITDVGIILLTESGRKNSKNQDRGLASTKTVFVHDLRKETIRDLKMINQGVNILAVESNSPPRCTRCSMESYTHITSVEAQVCDAVLMFYDIFKNLMQPSLAVNSGAPFVQTHLHPSMGYSGILKHLQSACDAGEWNICHQLNKPVEYNLYFIPVGSDRDPIPLGQWTENTGLSTTTTYPDITNRLFSHKLTDFGGINLRVVMHGKHRPFSIRANPGNSTYFGMMIDIMDDLAKRLNFSYTITEPPDGQFGSKTPDGNFTGMVGMVATGEADIGAATFTVTTERSEVVDFTTGFMQDSLGIITPSVKKAHNPFQVFKPFALETWLAILAALILSCVIFVFISVRSSRWTIDSKRQHAVLEKNIGENVFLIISSFFEQGPTFQPTSSSPRCFLTFWFVFTLLTMSMFTAHLAAALTVTTPVKPIDTLQDLVEQTDFAILSEEGSSIWSLFNRSEQPLYREIAARMVTTNASVNRTEMVREGTSCYITDRSYLEYVASQSCGEIRLARDRFHGFPLAFIITKGSPYKAAIDHSFQKMVESGVIAALLRKWMRPRTYCPTKEHNEHIQPLSLDALGGIFILYLAVTFVSIIILFIQLLYHHFCR